MIFILISQNKYSVNVLRILIYFFLVSMISETDIQVRMLP